MISILLLPGKIILAQIQISPPVFDYVSINPDNGKVTIHWSPSPTPSVVGYVIQEELITGQNYPIETVYITTAPYSHTFSYPKVLTAPVHFNIVAIDGAGNESIRTTPSHISMFSEAGYDSCKATITVKWSPYVGWGTRLSGYNVFQVDDNFVITKFDDVSSGTTQYSVPNIQENKSYCFYVSAIRNDGTSSFSNKVCVTTTSPLPPSFIKGDYTQYSGINQLNLHFSIDPATVSDMYRLYRSDATLNDYKVIAELTKDANGTITYSDAFPSSKVYNYKLQYLNRCKAEGVSSIPINNILLKVKSEAMTNKLSWNSFSSWSEGTKQVNLYRSASPGSFELLATLSPNETEYSDLISAESKMSGDICYQVQAISQNNRDTSKSNIFCVNMLGDVFVPNAFTPNGDGQNDVFKPSFAILPAKYLFSIYDRYGVKIYETTNISEGWDGLLPNNKKALEGAYIYYLRIENGAKKVLEKRGNFTVIYP